jgi:hypothetical protein
LIEKSTGIGDFRQRLVGFTQQSQARSTRHCRSNWVNERPVRSLTRTWLMMCRAAVAPADRRQQGGFLKPIELAHPVLRPLIEQRDHREIVHGSDK